ncbi:DEAD/DEAH box helicase [uncultured Paludibaculum sp.]|uniref:DEAD/DEAH box helicase n=1 Tax=uncultured Paludibaculum sp. TaxID=1765020 RepID=UPI002AAB1BD3|nr:DEAD/DEAH box helicase [uncultured Paludibaculum sp.]
MNNFSELSLSPVLKENLVKNCFVEPTPVQAEAIPPALEGRDVVATAQTGTGKTLAFVLPVLESLLRTPIKSGVGALILSPTRELAIQIQETFQRVAAGSGLRAAVVVGGLNEQRQLHDIRRGAQVIIATPGRLCDFLDRRLVRLGTVRHLVLDEADRMLDMGFMPALKMILAAMPAERQTLFFSATIEHSVAHLINEHLKNPIRIAIGSATKPAEQVDLHVYEVEQDRKLGLLHSILKDESGSVLVFARTKHGTDRLARKLGALGVKAARIHGDRTQNQRNEALKGFQQGHYRVLVATDVAARGIHVDGIAHVVNYDLPQVPEDFIHRVGRTGRAGARGVASTFSTRNERSEIRRIERTLKVTLTRRTVGAEIEAEQNMKLAPVVVLPVSNHRQAPRPESSASRGRRSFGPPARRRA